MFGRRKQWMVVISLFVSFLIMTPLAYADTPASMQHNLQNGKTAQGLSRASGCVTTTTVDTNGNPLSVSTVCSPPKASFTAPTTEIGTIKGNSLFEPMANPPKIPVLSNYVFDANGFVGRFDPIYWLANIVFTLTVFGMFLAMEFFSIGYAGNGLNDITGMVLKILHSAYLHIAVPLIPLVGLVLIGVFLWFGVVKKDLPSVFSRAAKTMMTFLLLVMLSTSGFANSGVLQKVGDFPGVVGNFFGGLVESVVAGATGESVGGTANLINNAWIDLVLSEWVVGEEGQNYSVNGKKVVPLLDKSSAWRSMLGYPPPNNSTRNGIATTLEQTPDGQTAFSSVNRLITSCAALVGNAGPVLYFLVMGGIMLFARLAFLILVAAGAVILPLELFPVTRSTTMALRWVQFMAMSLFAIFFVSAYTSVLLGLNQIISKAFSNGVFGAGISTGFAEGLDDFTFLGQGLGYVLAIIGAWILYKKMQPMQRIRAMTDKAASRGVPVGWGQRLTAQARRSSLWEKPTMTRKSFRTSQVRTPKASEDRREVDRERQSEATNSATASHRRRPQPVSQRESQLRGDSFSSPPEVDDSLEQAESMPVSSVDPLEISVDDASPSRTATGDPFFDIPREVESNERGLSPPSRTKSEDSTGVRERRVHQPNWLRTMNVHSPDDVMDTLMGATLGKAANTIAEAGGKVTTGTLKIATKAYQRKKSRVKNQSAPMNRPTARPTFRRSQTWTVVDADVTTPPNRTSRYNDWVQKTMRESRHEARTSKRPLSNVGQVLPPPSLQKSHPERRFTSIKRHYTGKEIGLGGAWTETRPVPRFRPKGTGASRIRHKRSPENPRKPGVKRQTPSSARPNLRRKGPRLADRVFGDRH